MKCSFCSKNIDAGRGKIFVKTDGRALYFCSNKCEKNMMKLGRNPRTTAWTGEARTAKAEGKSEKKKRGKR